jgi:hypothetical protein
VTGSAWSRTAWYSECEIVTINGAGVGGALLAAAVEQAQRLAIRHELELELTLQGRP